MVFRRTLAFELKFNGTKYIEVETPLITNINKIEIEKLIIPNTSNIIRNGINNQIEINGTIIELNEGIYTQISLRNELQNKITQFNNQFNVGIDINRIKYIFTFGSNINIRFLNKTGDLLGFKNDFLYENVNEIISQFPYRIMQTPVYYLNIKEFESANFNKYFSNVVINNDAEIGGLLSFNKDDMIYIEELPKITSIIKLSFNLIDEYGNAVNLLNHRSFISINIYGN